MQRCSKIAICNRSRASGENGNFCAGDYDAMAMCPEWRAVIAQERIEKLITELVTKRQT